MMGSFYIVFASCRDTITAHENTTRSLSFSNASLLSPGQTENYDTHIPY